jgi:hypothetical protein
LSGRPMLRRAASKLLGRVQPTLLRPPLTLLRQPPAVQRREASTLLAHASQCAGQCTLLANTISCTLPRPMLSGMSLRSLAPGNPWRRFFSSTSDYYQILSVPRTATTAEIKKAYFAAAKRCHPDLHPGKEAQFRMVNEAYECLRDSSSRAAYDRGSNGSQQHQHQQHARRDQYTSSRWSGSQQQQQQQQRQWKQQQQQQRHQDIFRQVWSELGFDEVDEYVRQIQKELHHAMTEAGANANFGPGWEFAVRHKALVLGTLLPITLIVRSPALTAASLRVLPFSLFLARSFLPLHLQWYFFSRLWIAAIKYVEKQVGK